MFKKFFFLLLLIALIVGIILGMEIVQTAKELMQHYNGW